MNRIFKVVSEWQKNIHRWDLQAPDRCRSNSPRPLPARSLLTNKGSAPPKYKVEKNVQTFAASVFPFVGRNGLPSHLCCRSAGEGVADGQWWRRVELNWSLLLLQGLLEISFSQVEVSLWTYYTHHRRQSRGPDRKEQIIWPDFNAVPGVGGANLLHLRVLIITSDNDEGLHRETTSACVWAAVQRKSSTCDKAKSLPPLTFAPWVWGKEGKMILWCQKNNPEAKWEVVYSTCQVL